MIHTTVYIQTLNTAMHGLQLRVLASPLKMMLNSLVKPWHASIEAHVDIRHQLSTMVGASDAYFTWMLEELRRREMRLDDSLQEAYRLFGILVQAVTRFAANWRTYPVSYSH